MKVNMDNEFEKDFLEVERKFAVKLHKKFMKRNY